ncbi:MAG: hypothetical protein SGI84_02560 [Gemmatimonadota bacterium]|nr:hypothetical protein [Gemmatimonadota bacterium]
MLELKTGAAVVMIIICVAGLLSERWNVPPSPLGTIFWLMLWSAEISFLQAITSNPAWEWFLVAVESVVVIALLVAVVQLVRRKKEQAL